MANFVWRAGHFLAHPSPHPTSPTPLRVGPGPVPVARAAAPARTGFGTTIRRRVRRVLRAARRVLDGLGRDDAPPPAGVPEHDLAWMSLSRSERPAPERSRGLDDLSLEAPDRSAGRRGGEFW